MSKFSRKIVEMLLEYDKRYLGNHLKSANYELRKAIEMLDTTISNEEIINSLETEEKTMLISYHKKVGEIKTYIEEVLEGLLNEK